MTEQNNHSKPHRVWPLYVLCATALLVSALNVLETNDLGMYKANKWEVEFLEDRFDLLEPTVDSLDNLSWYLRYERNHKGEIDLTHQGYTPLDEIFFFSDAAVNQHLAGVKVSGRIINTSSITYKNLRFRIEMVGGRNTFTIARISPGNSTPFTVYVPDVSIRDSETAWITNETGSIYFNR